MRQQTGEDLDPTEASSCSFCGGLSWDTRNCLLTALPTISYMSNILGTKIISISEPNHISV
jgi:hypothetical protein